MSFFANYCLCSASAVCGDLLIQAFFQGLQLYAWAVALIQCFRNNFVWVAPSQEICMFQWVKSILDTYGFKMVALLERPCKRLCNRRTPWMDFVHLPINGAHAMDGHGVSSFVKDHVYLLSMSSTSVLAILMRIWRPNLCLFAGSIQLHLVVSLSQVLH